MDDWLRVPADRKGMQARRAFFALLVLVLTMYLAAQGADPAADHAAALR